MSKGKMGNINLLKVGCDTTLQFHSYQGWHLEGVATYRLNGRKYKVAFICGEQLSFKCAFLERNGGHIPTERLDREALLVLIYGEIQKFLGRQEMINYFTEERRKEEEEKKRKEQEEKAKQIALGEQISIEKYLKNI